METTSSRRSNITATAALSIAISTVLALFILPAAAIMCELTKTPFPTRRYIAYWIAFAVLTALGSYAIGMVDTYRQSLRRDTKTPDDSPAGA